MIGLGRTYSNLMVSMTATNEKLHERSVTILREATGNSAEQCHDALLQCSGRVPLALTWMLSGADLEAAEQALAQGGSVRAALRTLGTAS